MTSCCQHKRERKGRGEGIDLNESGRTQASTSEGKTSIASDETGVSEGGCTQSRGDQGGEESEAAVGGSSPALQPPCIYLFIIIYILLSEYEQVRAAAAVSWYLPLPSIRNNSNSNYSSNFNN
jgi:hypothetical protein